MVTTRSQRAATALQDTDRQRRADVGGFAGVDEPNNAAIKLRPQSRTQKSTSKAQQSAHKGKKPKLSKSEGQEKNSTAETTAIVTAGQSKTIFDLPAELRNFIWALAVVQGGSVLIAAIRPFITEPALLAVSRQVRSEAMSIWYAEHDFIINGSSPAVKFLRSRSNQQLLSIRSLCIASEKSKQMTEAPRAWLDHLRKKMDTLMDEFESRGLRKKALRFQVMSEGELKWVDGETMQEVEVQGPADKAKRIRAGPREGQIVPGLGSQQ